MSLTKHSSFTVLSARIAGATTPRMKTAHRHSFEYEPKQGYLYVRSRAISSRTNDNFDEFPAEEIKQAYATFIGKPVFVNHHNDNHRRARGVIKDAVLHEDSNADGSPDVWVEVLMEVDAIRFPKLAKAILAGEIDRTSMGTDVAFSKCSFCGNKAASPVEYCKHIPKMKGQRIYRRTANGSQEGILVREICYGLGFFENSLLVEEPADPTAFFLGVDDHSGMAKAASKTATDEAPTVSGVCVKAADTGRILLIQRSIKDDKDPAAGTWEAPGGHHEDGDLTSLHAGIREWEEEVGQPFPEGGHVAHTWRSGPYQGHVVIIPSEDAVCLHEGRVMTNPDDPDLDDHENAAWWDPKDAKGNPVIRPELAKANVFDTIGKVAGEDAHRIGPWRSFEEHPDVLESRRPTVDTDFDDPNTAYFNGLHDGLHLLKQMSDRYATELPAEAYEEGYERGVAQRAAAAAARTAGAKQPMVLGHEIGWDRVPGPDGKYHSHCSCGDVGPARDDNASAYVDALTHIGPSNPDRDDEEINARERAMHNPPPKAPQPRPQKWVEPEWVLRASKHPQAFAKAGSKTAGPLNYDITLGCGDNVRYVGSQPGQVSSGDIWTCKNHGEQKVTQVSGTGTQDKGLGWDKESSRRTALDKALAPQEVDTMRDEVCPVCGESDTYDGDKCQVCGYLTPPDTFTDPNLEKAKQTDLRQDKNDEQGGGLTCDQCGATFPSGPAKAVTTDQPKQAVVMDPNRGTDEQEAAGVETAVQAGDACPDCGAGTLQATPVADPAADEAATPQMGDPNAQFLPAGSASQDDAGDQNASDESDDQDGEDGSKPDFLKDKKKKPTANRRVVRSQKEQSMRPALAALAAQQKQIEALRADNSNLRQTVAFIAEVAGINEHPRVTAGLKATAVDENPAFGGGWDGVKSEPAPQAPVATTQEAATPQAKADVEAVGEGPLTDVAPDATTSLTDTGVVLPVAAPANQDVEAPVAGTDDLGKGSRGEAGTNRIETDVRAGTPSDNSAAFRDGGFLGSKSEGRTIAGLRLARLRIQAGIAEGDDLDLGQTIAASDVSDETIQSEIDTLAMVVNASKAPARPVSRNLVPQAARTATRTVPSMTAAPGIEIVGSVQDEEMAFE